MDSTDEENVDEEAIIKWVLFDWYESFSRSIDLNHIDNRQIATLSAKLAVAMSILNVNSDFCIFLHF